MESDMKKPIQRSSGQGHGESERVGDIIRAAMAGNATYVARLLMAGADVNTKDSETGYTALHIAAVNGDQRLLDVLLKHHQEFDDLDFTATTNNPPRLAWQLAFSHHHPEIGETLDLEYLRQSKNSNAL